MIVRGKDGTLAHMSRIEYLNDDKYYTFVARGKDIEMNHLNRGEIQFDDILHKISTNGRTESVGIPKRKNSMEK